MFARCPKPFLGLAMVPDVTEEVTVLSCFIVLSLAALAWILLTVFRRR